MSKLREGSRLLMLDICLQEDYQTLYAKKILNEIKLFDPHAIIAGGFIRDKLFDKEVADIDIFLNTRGETLSVIDDMFLKFGIGIDDMTFGDNLGEQYVRNPNLRCVYTSKQGILPVQFILMKGQFDTYGIVETFPLNICQFWWNGVGDASATRESTAFLKDENRKVVKTNEAYADGDRYINKIRDKYPEFDWSDISVKGNETMSEMPF